MKNLIKLFLFFLLTITAVSQQSGSKMYTLEECLEIAKEKNFNIQLIQNRISSAEAELRNAFGDYLPGADFSMGYTRTLNVDGPSRFSIGGSVITLPGADPDAYTMNGAISYNLFDGFNREANYKRAENNLEAVEFLTDQVFHDVKLDVYNYYIDIIKNYQIVKVRQENINQSKKQLESIIAKNKAGMLPITSVYAQEAELGNLEFELVTAENQLRLSKSNLLAIMGIDPSEEAEFYEKSLPTNISDEEILAFKKEIGSIDRMMEAAMDLRLDYKAQIASHKSAKQQVKMAKSIYFPRVNAFAGWRWNNSEFSDFDENGKSYVGVNLSLPIFQNFRPGNQVQSAKLQAKQREIELRTKEQQIKNEVQTAYLNLQSAEKQVKIANRSVFASQKNYESTKERFDVGSSSITDLILANYQFISSEVNRINAVYNYVAAQSSVLHAIGKL